MAITIGRVGYSAPTLDDPQTVRFDGDQVRLAGVTRASSVANAVVLRDQLRGLAGNTDEPVVPIVFATAQASYNGWYQIDGVASEMTAADAALADVRWEVAATRIASFAQAFSESRCVVGLLTNSHGITTANAAGEVGAPSSAVGATPTEVMPNSTSAYDAYGVVTGADGDVFVAGLKTSVFTGLTTPAIFRYAVPIDRWYIGGCRIQMASSYVIGRQCVDSPTSWQLDNGLVKITASATAGAFDVSWYDGTQWDTAKTFAIWGPTPGTVSGFHHVAILRNGIEAVTIRLGLQNSGGFNAYADVTVKRGSRWVQVYVADALGSGEWGIKRTAVEAATALTGGIRATANDAAGNRYILASPHALTTDLVNGSIRRNPGTGKAFLGIGCEVGGSGAASPFTAQVQIYRFIGQANETARVVGR